MKGFGKKQKSTKNKIKKINYSKAEVINLAITLHSQGKISEALKYYRYCINQGFSDCNIFSNYGVILQSFGRLEEAEVSYRKAIELDPNFVEPHSNLGIILANFGRLEEAEVSYRKAIELNPNFINAHSNLGNLLSKLGRLDEAEISYRKAIDLDPNQVNSYLNLGNILRDFGRLEEAEVSYRKAIELDPNFVEPHSNLGIILANFGRLEEAEVSYRKAIELNPNFKNAHSNLGNLLNNLGRLQEAELSYRKAIELDPNQVNSYLNQGNLLRDFGRLEEAESSYRKAIELDPNFSSAYFNLFRHYEEINNLEKLKKALKEFNQVETIKNELFLFSARLSFRTKNYKNAKELIDNISTQWTNQTNSSQKLLFWSYKAFIEDKLGNYDIAYSCFKKSQDDSSYQKLNKNSYLNLIDSYKESIVNKKSINQFSDEKEDFNLVFLIGFPRSGTTLLDTMLRSHNDIQVIEEKPMIENIEELIQVNYDTEIVNFYSLSNNERLILRGKYFEFLKEYSNNKKSLIIDKLPLNTVSLPLINFLFPNARIIFTYRHPYDTVLSCFQQFFSPNIAMANLVSLKSSAKMYDRVMNAWNIYKNSLPINFVTSKYEDLVEDFELNTSKILKFLDLEWDNKIRNYRKTALDRGKINTPSFSQVIQPLYKSSICKWMNYEKYFDDCHQYLEKWVEYFDY